MSSISRRRNGLMALSVLGAPVLGEVFSPRSQDRTPASATPRDPSLAAYYRGSGLVLRPTADPRRRRKECRPMLLFRPVRSTRPRARARDDGKRTFVPVGLSTLIAEPSCAGDADGL